MLTPIILEGVDLDNINEESQEIQTSRTYKINFETGEIMAEFIDHEDAVIQAAVKAIKTMRDRYLIYSMDYGSEIFYLIGKAYSQEYLDIEVPRLVNEVFITDDRILETSNYKIEKIEDTLYIKFDMLINSGETVEVEVEL